MHPVGQLARLQLFSGSVFFDSRDFGEPPEKKHRSPEGVGQSASSILPKFLHLTWFYSLVPWWPGNFYILAMLSVLGRAGAFPFASKSSLIGVVDRSLQCCDSPETGAESVKRE